MASELKEIYGKLKSIKEYLIKLGPSRRTPKVKKEKCSEASTLYSRYNLAEELVIKQISSKELNDRDIKIVTELCKNIKSLYLRIKELTELTELTENINMEKFELKTAVSLLPVMTGDEKVTKQLISNIEMYSNMIGETEKTNLITFVLKSRLSENAKLRMCETYTSVSSLIKDMRERLLAKKSDTAIQQKLQRVQQGTRRIEEFGKEIEQLFVDLTISQASGDQQKYAILKPINEKNAIKRFSDGLRNGRLSTIIAARNYSTLSDAIQGAIDEQLSCRNEGEVMNFHRGKSTYHQHRGNSTYRGRGSFRGAMNSSESGRGYHRGNSYSDGGRRNFSPRYRVFRGRNSYRGWNGGRGFSRNEQVNMAETSDNRDSNDLNVGKKESENLFFRS